MNRRKACGIVGTIALVLVAFPARAQWERVAGGSPQNLRAEVANTPHPLAYFLEFSPERYADNSLCLGCKASDGQEVTIGDYAVKASTREVGQSFGRKILEIVLTFDVKSGSVMSRLEHEWEANYRAEGQQVSLQDVAPVEWKSIVVESTPNLYRELYFIIDAELSVHPLEHARIVNAGGVPVLAVSDPVGGNGGECTEGYWVLRRDGPWLLDFSSIQKKIASISPPNARAPQIGCWALSIEKLEINAPLQDEDPDCHACGWVGEAVVHFTIDNNHAVPLSSHFEPHPAK